MAVWAVGDIQGCFGNLERLLKLINFNQKRDILWVAGDLVNRGDSSLEVLNYLYSARDSIRVVLGNHDISLIGAFYGLKRVNPTIEPILNAGNSSELIGWLRSQPLLVWDFNLGYMMSHAGVSPEFDFGMAKYYADRVERRLKSPDVSGWLREIFRGSSDIFDPNMTSIDMDRYILNSFTRMRYCHRDGRLDFSQKGRPSQHKIEYKGLYPWFACPTRRPTH